LEIILTHTNADFDAVAALLAAHKLYPQTTPVLPDRVNGNVADFLLLHGGRFPFVRLKDVRGKPVERIILVDTQRLPDTRLFKVGTPTDMIDHHLPARELELYETFTGESTGAVTTLLVEDMRAKGITLNSLEATLLALGVYEDTGSLVYGTTTPRDVMAAAWLLEQQADLDIVRRFLTPPLKPEQQALLDKLLQSAESRLIHGYPIVVAAAVSSEYVVEVSAIAHRLRDLLDPAALFVVAGMANVFHLVCRATNDSLDVGEVARVFGGGGHHRAAAATIHDKTQTEIVDTLWQELERHVRPQTRVSDLMSYSAQTVDANQRVSDVIQLVRRVGHEGYPVVENGAVVGLLTHRDAARAIEHDLGDLQVREVMLGGAYTLHPNESVSTLEQLMVETGWGQIPVVDNDNHLIGIVTRTDLIRHWAGKHPKTPTELPTITLDQIDDVLGSGVKKLIESISRHADEQGRTLYMVGGVVRDLLLHRTNLDVDFVVEQNAIDFAQTLKTHYGGEITSFRPFGTAKWHLDAHVKAKLGINANIPEHLDFATARFEFYEHPTALPTVYDSSIKLDLQRRDFTINALAIQLSSENQRGRILDFYGGQRDLEARLIRVLHSLSFVDDPTRILRAVRFARRLDFTIEPRTAELMTTALPMLHRITGERVRNEITLLLREQAPEHGLLDLQTRGALAAIHPAFVLDERIVMWFEAVRTSKPLFQIEALEISDLYWHLIGCNIRFESLAELCERLLIGRSMATSMLNSAQLAYDHSQWSVASPSQITTRLRSIPDVALWASWHVLPERERSAIERYMNEWRYVKIKTDGHVLQSLGLPPGPRYKIILERLLAARLDGEILTDADEQSLLQSLLDKDERDDDV
jgi:tRNA nucleotidyltransferase (CCA-adding enzyme)